MLVNNHLHSIYPEKAISLYFKTGMIISGRLETKETYRMDYDADGFISTFPTTKALKFTPLSVLSLNPINDLEKIYKEKKFVFAKDDEGIEYEVVFTNLGVSNEVHLSLEIHRKNP